MHTGDFVQIEPAGPPDDADAPGTVSYMDYTLFCQLADRLPEMTDLRLQGRCDPLLHLHLFDMVRYAVQRGLLVSIATGLTALSEQRAEECVRSGLYRIRVMVNASGTPLAGAGPVQPRFLRVLRNLRRLMHARTALQQLQPEVSLTAVLDRRDLPELPRLVRFAHEEGIADVTVEVADRDTATAAQQGVRQRSVLREAQALARTLGITLQPLRFLRDGRVSGDTAPSGCISHSGRTCAELRCGV